MAIYKSDIVDINLETGSIHRSFLNHTIGSGDNSANRFGVRTFRDGVPADLSGASCQAVFMNAAGVNISLTSYGAVSGNEAYVTLPQACYNVEGQFCLAIKLVKDGVTGTMRIVDGVVSNTGTDGAVAPTSSVPTYQEILSTYDAMTAATAAANTAIAETFNAATAYPAGKYVINSGALYRLTADHAANVTWANTSKVAVNFGDEVTSLKSALVKDSVPDFVKGGLNGTTGAEVDADNFARCGYIYVDSAVNVHIDHEGHPEYRIYVYVYNENKVYQSTSGLEYSYSLTNFTGYIRVALRNTNISDLTTENINTLKAALHIEMNNAVPSITKLYSKTSENKNYIDSIVHYKVRTDIPYNLLSNVNFILQKYVDNLTGEIKTDTTNCVSDYVPIDPSYGYICKNTNVYNFYYDVANDSYHQTYDNSFVRYAFAFYDINKIFIPFTGTITDSSAAIPSNAAYIRVTLANEAAIKTARLIYGNEQSRPNIRQVESQLKPTNDYLYHPVSGYENLKMVMFGDSITHGDLFISDDGVSYVDYAGDYLGATLYNVGLGGTRMALAPNQTLSGRYLMTFFNLCQCIVDNDWTDIDTYLQNNPSESSYLPHITRLKAIEWDKIHGICLMYGANDFMSGTPLGTAYNTDYNKFDGACAYGLNLLLTKYPHLQVILFTPMYRQPTDGDVATDTDNAPNSAGLYMYQYGESLKHVSEVVHCPVVDLYHTVGINKYNKKLLMKDGTHPRTTLACKRMGRLFAEQIKQYIFPLI